MNYKTLKIYCQNQYPDWEINTTECTDYAKKIFEYYLSCPEISENCCLNGYNYKTISFDFLFCDKELTHEVNKNYRQKDYPADIITFAVFADSSPEDRIIIDLDINLGEVIIALDKIEQQAQEKNIERSEELYFFISHGILHLLGFDHQTEEEFNFVVEHQKLALQSIGIKYDKI